MKRNIKANGRSEAMQKARGLSKMTQEQFAARLGITRGHLAKLETGVVDPSILLVQRAAAVAERPIKVWTIFGAIPKREGS